MENFRCFLLASILVICFLSGCKGPLTNNQDRTVESQAVLEEGTIEIEGFALNYIRRGTGIPVMVIGSAYHYSKAFSKELESKFDLIFIDSRHFSPNCNPGQGMLDSITLATFSEDVETIRKQLGLSKVGILGHSIHAQIAMDYAVNHSDNMDFLILVGGVPYKMSELAEHQESYWESDASEQRKAIFSANMEALGKFYDSIPENEQFAVLYDYSAPKYWIDPEYDASELLDSLRTCPPVMARLFASIPSKKEMNEKLNQFSVPTLVILGKLDFGIPYHTWDELLSGHSEIDLILMENASHNPHAEGSTAQSFDRHLIDWITGLDLK